MGSMTVTTPTARPRLDAAHTARLDALRTFVAEHQRPPRRHSISSGEKALAEWMVQAVGRPGMGVLIRRIITVQDRALPRPVATPRAVAGVATAPAAPAPVPSQRPGPARTPRIPAAVSSRASQTAAPRSATAPVATPGERTPIQWLRELQRFLDEQRRLPSPEAEQDAERELAVWMRAERRAGNKFVSVAIASRGLNGK